VTGVASCGPAIAGPATRSAAAATIIRIVSLQKPWPLLSAGNDSVVTGASP
jgi:hypothetical protein